MKNSDGNQVSEKLMNTAKEIQAILERDGCAIHAFFRGNEQGHAVPDARLVELKQEDDTTTTDEGTVPAEDKPVEGEQPAATDESPSTEG